MKTAVRRLASQTAADQELEGYFGPQSMMWRLNRECVQLLGGGRAVLMQIAHPLVAAGVGDHSSYSHDPWGRTARTIDLTGAIVWGTRSEAHAGARTINQLHKHVTGTLGLDAGALTAGTHYRARDPELLLWVEATLIDTTILLYSLLVEPLTDAEIDQYYEESRQFVALLGLPGSLMPATYADFQDYMREMVESELLAVTPAAQQSARLLMRMPVPAVLRPVVSPLYIATEQATIGLLPPRLRAQYGYTWDGRRQALLDAGMASTRRLLPLLPSTLRDLPWARAAYRRVATGHTDRCA